MSETIAEDSHHGPYSSHASRVFNRCHMLCGYIRYVDLINLSRLLICFIVAFKVFGFVMVFLGWYNSGFPLPTIGLCTVYSASLCQTNDLMNVSLCFSKIEPYS